MNFKNKVINYEALNNLLIFRFYLENLLRQRGYINFNVYNYNKWHHNYAYFTAKKKGKKFFIKVDFKFKLLTNDLLAYKIADRKLKEYMVKIEDFIEINDIAQIIVFEFLENYRPLKEDDLINNEVVINKIIEILRLLKINNIIHRDLKLDNFLIDCYGNIKIIDFTFAVSSKYLNFKDLDLTLKNLKTLKYLGEGFKPKYFEWNDCYSFKQILFNIKNMYNDFCIDKYFYSIEKINCETYKIKPPIKYYLIKSLKYLKFLKNFFQNNLRRFRK